MLNTIIEQIERLNISWKHDLTYNQGQKSLDRLSF